MACAGNEVILARWVCKELEMLHDNATTAIPLVRFITARRDILV